MTADRIPFGGSGRGKGGKSAYIQGLISFWEKRGLSGREAVGAAFATAHVHAREGMPTRASYIHSNTGERTGFVRAAIAERIDEIQRSVEQKFGAFVELQFANALKNSEYLTVET